MGEEHDVSMSIIMLCHTGRRPLQKKMFTDKSKRDKFVGHPLVFNTKTLTRSQNKQKSTHILSQRC